MTSPSTDRRYGVNSGLAVKAPCRLATTSNITLNGLQAIDGAMTAANDRVLVKNQTDATENAIYIADTGDWVRDYDFDGNRDIVTGTSVFVTAGSTNANTYWKVSSANPITIGTSAITFTAATVNDAATIAYTPAGTGAVATTVQTKLREFVSVKDFGAVGDNTTDDTAAIQAALTASLRVFIPAGTYKITSTLTLRNNQHIIGESTLSSVLQASTDITVMSATNNSQITLEDFEIFGVGSGSSTKYGLQWTNTPYCVFNRIYVYGFSKGVYFKSGGSAPQSSFSNSFNNCVIQANTINIDCEAEVNNLNLYSTRLGSATIGVRFLDSNTLMVLGCDFEACTTCAIQIDSASAATEVGATIAGNHFESNTSTTGDINIGVSFEMRGISITGNLFYGGAANVAPVKLFKASGVVFSGNTVTGTYTSATPVLGTTTIVEVFGNYPAAVNIDAEGTWTPNQGAGLTLVGAFSSSGTYKKVGNLVTVTGVVTGATSVACTGASLLTSNLPYQATITGGGTGVAVKSDLSNSSTFLATTTGANVVGAIAAVASIYFSCSYVVA